MKKEDGNVNEEAKVVIDPKYINVPNICFSLTKADDRRDEEFALQRIKRGFDDSETWSLTNTIADFIIPRIERYNDIASEILKRSEEDIRDTKTLTEALRLISRDNGSWNWSEEESKTVQEGLEALPRIFLSLWW